MWSKNIHPVALRNKIWDGKGKLHWSKTYGTKMSWEVYCSRRMWRIYSLVAPSLDLNPNATVDELPFSVKVERKLNIRDVMAFTRDHYEGTPYDLTKGLAAGPYGNPNRYDRGEGGGLSMNILMQGTFERGISLFRTAYTFVTQSRSWLPDQVGGVVWFAPSTPHASLFVPLYPSAYKLPDSLVTGHLYEYNRDSMWWACTVVQNWMERMYVYISQDVKESQNQWEATQIRYIGVLEGEVLGLIHSQNIEEARTHLTSVQNHNVQQQSATWWRLFEHLVAKYINGYRLDDFHAETIDPVALFYPKEWLQSVGFWTSPPDPLLTSWQDTVDDNSPTPLVPWEKQDPKYAPKWVREQLKDDKDAKVKPPTSAGEEAAEKAERSGPTASGENPHTYDKPSDQSIVDKHSDKGSRKDNSSLTLVSLSNAFPLLANENNSGVGYVTALLFAAILCIGIGIMIGRAFTIRSMQKQYQSIHDLDTVDAVMN